MLPLAESQGKTVVLKAPSKMGKTSLLVRYLDRCRQGGKRVAFLDFQLPARPSSTISAPS